MMKITQLGIVKVRSWSTLPQFSRVFRSEIACAFSSPLCSSIEGKKIVFTFGKFHHSTTFSLQKYWISCHEWCIFCLKENHLRKKNKNPCGLNFKVLFLRQLGGRGVGWGESALSRLTRHSLCFCTQKKKDNCKKFSFPDCQSESSSLHTWLSEQRKLFLLSQGALHRVLGQISGRNLYCPCLFFQSSSRSVPIRTYWIKEASWELLDVQISLQGSGRRKVWVFIAPSTF